MTPQQLAELAEQAANKINKLTNLDSYAFSNQDVNDMNYHNFKDGFIKGYEASQSKWISVENEGLPTDNNVRYFIAKDGLYHNHLYRCSEVFDKHNDFGITHYMAFVLPLPPKP